MQGKWYDVTHPKPKETRSATQIIQHMKNRLKKYADKEVE